VKVAGRWRYVYRAIDQFGQVVDVFVSPRRDLRAARGFFARAIGTTRTMPSEVLTDRAPTYPVVLEESLPAAWHDTERYANNRVECDHGRLKARLRPMRGLKQDRSARIVIAGHAFLQNIHRGHYELAVEAPVIRRMAVTLTSSPWRSDASCPPSPVEPAADSPDATVPSEDVPRVAPDYKAVADRPRSTAECCPCRSSLMGRPVSALQ